jgi:hypothetical protein
LSFDAIAGNAVQFPSGENVTRAYICDSCGGISTITWDTGHCIFCGSVTDISPEDAVEVPIPKCEFGTEFVAVVYRGKVVDILLCSERTSVDGYLTHQELVRVQEYVDHLEPADEPGESEGSILASASSRTAGGGFGRRLLKSLWPTL